MDARALVAALHRISQLAAHEGDLLPALQKALPLLCDAAGFIAGDALVPVPRERLRGTGVVHGGTAAFRTASAHVELALEHSSATFRADFRDDPRAAELASCGIRSALVCPIVGGDEVAAVLELFAASPEPPKALASEAAEQAAAMLGRVVERMGARRSLQLGEDLFRSLCEALPVGVVLTDDGGAALYMNPAMEEMAGFRLADSTPRRWEDFIHPADRARVLAGWDELRAKGGSFRADFRIGSGEQVRWCELMTTAMPTRGYVSVFEDMTARVAAEQELRKSEDRFRAIFEGAGVGLALGTADGGLMRVNRAYADFLGYAPYELAGRNLRELVDADHVSHTMVALREVHGRRSERIDLEREYVRRDGTRVWGRTTLTRLPDTDLLIAVVQDIDARKRAEDAVRHLSGRILRLQDEERRRIARSLHESAAQTIAALSMNLQRMERMALPADAAATLKDSLELVTQTSREVRTLSHLLHPPLLEEVGLPSSLRWYVQGFGQRSNVEVSLDIADDLGRLSTEMEITLFRVVQESLTNVHRHSGSASASVRLRRRGPQVVLEVEDRGVGLSPEVLERINAQTSATVGVGIAGMRERLSQLGGSLEVAAVNPGTLVRASIRSE